MKLIRREGEAPARARKDSPYMVHGKRVVREMEVYKSHRD